MFLKELKRVSQMVLPLPRAWKAQESAVEIRDQLGLLMLPHCRYLDAYIRPDYGWDAAMSICEFGMQRNGFFDGRTSWIWLTAMYLQGKLPQQQHHRKVEAIHWAWKLRHDVGLQGLRRALEGALVVAGATREKVCQMFNFEPEVIDAYETLFWNVVDRAADLAYLQNLIYPSGRLEEMVGGYMQTANLDNLLRRIGYNSGLEDLAWGAGLRLTPVNSTTISVAKEQNERLTLSIGALMLRNFGHYNEQHPQVVSSRQLLAAAKIGGLDESNVGGDDDFSKFAETLLASDVSMLQAKIRETMNS